jgi:hypothetical protein
MKRRPRSWKHGCWGRLRTARVDSGYCESANQTAVDGFPSITFEGLKVAFGGNVAVQRNLATVTYTDATLPLISERDAPSSPLSICKPHPEQKR